MVAVIEIFLAVIEIFLHSYQNNYINSAFVSEKLLLGIVFSSEQLHKFVMQIVQVWVEFQKNISTHRERSSWGTNYKLLGFRTHFLVLMV
jgi:hypothetical protein